MDIELTILESLKIMEILPAQGNILSLRIAEDLREKVGFSAKEQEECQLKYENGNKPSESKITWKKEYIRVIKFEFKEIEMIRNSLEKLNEKELLTPSHIGLWKKFIEEEKEVKNG